MGQWNRIRSRNKAVGLWPTDFWQGSLNHSMEESSFHQIVLRELDAHAMPTVDTKAYAKWIKYLNVSVKMIKLLESCIVESLHCLWFHNGFSDMTQKTWKTKETIDNLGRFKIKNICASKDVIKVKRQTMYQETISANHLSEKGLVPIVCNSFKSIIKRQPSFF